MKSPAAVLVWTAFAATLVTPLYAVPQIFKDYGTTTIPINGSTILTFSVENPVGSGPLGPFSLVDNLQTGLEALSEVPLSNTCGGFSLITAGNITYSGGSLPDGGSCAVSYVVKGTSSGLKGNVVQGEGSLDGFSASAFITVLAPTFTKSFTGNTTVTPPIPTIPVNGTSTLTFTVANDTGTDLVFVGWTDDLPPGFTVQSGFTATPVGPQCVLGTVGITQSADSDVITMTGATVTNGSTCNFSVLVRGVTPSPSQSPLQTHVNFAQGKDDLLGVDTSTQINVKAPEFTKIFTPNVTALNNSTIMTITVGNHTGTNLADVRFSDPIPAGLIQDGPISSTGCSITQSGLPASFNVTIGALPDGSTCAIMLPLKVVPGGLTVKNNVVTGLGDLAGLLRSATLTVVKPALSKSVTPSTILGSTPATFTITVNNTLNVTLNHVTFTDALPAGLTLVPGSIVNNCNGSNVINTIDAILAPLTSCTVTFKVTGSLSGTYTNVVNGTAGGNLETLSASAPVTVETLLFTKAFNPAAILDTQTSTMTLTVTNPSAVTASFGFTDNLSAIGLSAPNTSFSACGGMVTVSGNQVTLANGSLAGGATCNVPIVVTPTSLGAKVNTADGSGDLAGQHPSSTLTVQTLEFTKAFNPPSILLNQTSQLTLTVNNPTTVNLTNFGFTDDLGAIGLTAPNATFAGCGGTVTVSANVVTLANGTLGAGLNCSIPVTVTATAVGTKNNTATGSGDLLGKNPIANLTVATPEFNKSFAPSSILLSQTSLLTLTVNNPTTVPLPNFGFTDNLTLLGLTAANNSFAACGGTVNVAGNIVTLTNGTLLPGTNCTVNIVVTPTSIGAKLNTASGSGDLQGKNPTATLTVGTPEFSKAFNPSSILANQTSTLTLTVNNPTGVTLLNFGFTDNLGSIGLSTPDTAFAACGGTVTITGNVVTLVNGTLAPGANCSIPVIVSAVSTGVKNNVATGSGDLAGKNPTAILTVGIPGFTKAFNPATILLTQTSVMTLTITNPTTVPLLNFGFTDNLVPLGLTAPNATFAACGGTVTVAANVVTLANGTLASLANCSIPITVTPTSIGAKVNTANGTGDLAGINPSGTLVVGTPSFTKSFVPPSIQTNQTSTLTFVIDNTTGVALTNYGFTDNLNLIGFTAPNATFAACGGTVTIAGNIITLANGTLGIGATCTIPIIVTPTGEGVKVNTANGTGDLITKNPSATVTVLPPAFSKVFSPSLILLTQTSTLTFTVTNPLSVTLANIGFTDSLVPIGLTSPNTSFAACGGTVTIAANVITLVNGTLAVGASCTIPVVVTPTSIGVKNNVGTGTGSLAGSNATATLTVVTPGFSKQFSPSSIQLAQTSVLTLSVSNTTGLLLSSFGFADNLAAIGLSAPNTSFAACGGTVTVAANVITLVNGTLAIGANCSIPVTVTPGTTGSKVNVATGSGDLANKTATDTLFVATGEFLFSKAFSAASVPINTNVNLTFTITNKSGANATQLGFTDALPLGMTIVNPPAAINGCGGNLQALNGATMITLTNGNLANTLSCSITVTVRSSTAGIKNNLAVGKDDLNGKDAPASILITLPVFSKVFSPNATNVGSIVRLTFTIPNNTAMAINVGFNDPLPGGLQVAAPPNIGIAGCGGAPVFNPAAAAMVLTLANGVVQPNIPCVIGVDLVNTSSGPKHNIATGTLAIDGQLAIADLDVFDAPTDAFQLRYFSNLTVGDSYINLTNSGASSTVGLPNQNGNLCVSAYTYSPDEQLISCCSCVVTPNGLNSLSVRNDLILSALTPVIPSSVVVKLLATRQNGACNAASPTAGDLRGGMLAWGATLHALPVTPGMAPGTYGMPETRFARGQLSVAELNRMTQLCAFIQSNGSGYGVCKSCKVGGLGASVK